MSHTLLTRELRTIRRVAPPDAPCDATLAMVNDAAVLVVDVTNACATQAMGFANAEHVWAPVDVWRRGDGHDVIMPRAVEPLELFLERRRRETMPTGEIVTLACSVMRGVTELAIDASRSPATGRWWVTDAGRPVFALVPGDAAGVASSRMCALLAEHAEDRNLVRLLGEAEAACLSESAEPRRECERHLVQLAAPRAVEIASLGLAPDALHQPVSLETAMPRRRSFDERRDESAPARPVMLAAAVRDMWERGWERARQMRTSRSASTRERATARRAQPASRKRVWALAASLATIVVAVGMLWPDGDGPRDGGESVTVTTVQDRVAESPAAAPADSTVVPSPTAAPADAFTAVDGQPEVTAVVARVMSAALTCEAEQSCSTLAVDPGLVTTLPHGGDVELLDDYGGIAVFRVRNEQSPAVTVAMEQRGEQWMIREVYDSNG